MQNRDFIIKSQGVATALRIGNWCAWKFLAATTAVLAWAMLQQFLSGHFSGRSLVLATMAGVMLVYFLIDAGMAALLYFAFKMKGQAVNKYQKVFSHFVVLLIIVKVVATMTTSLWAAPEMADVLTTNDKEKVAIEALLLADEAQNETVTAARNRLEQLEASENQRVAKAKREGKQMVEAAIKEGNKWQRDSYRRIGFAWLLSKDNGDVDDKRYARRIQTAQAKAEQLLEYERMQTRKATAYMATVSSDSSYQRIAALLADKADQERQDYLQKRNRRRGYIWLADVLAAIFGIFCTYLLSLREKAAGIDPPDKTVGSVFADALQQMRTNFIEHLESVLGVDIDADGYVGKPENDLKQAGTNSAVPATGMGFSAIKNRLEQDVGINSAETTETAVDTSVPAVPESPPPPAGTVILKQTETRDDIEQEVKAQVRRIQRYRSKWNDRGKGGGKPKTICRNIVDAFLIIKTLRTNGAISPDLAKKVGDYEQWFVAEVKPEIESKNS